MVNSEQMHSSANGAEKRAKIAVKIRNNFFY